MVRRTSNRLLMSSSLFNKDAHWDKFDCILSFVLVALFDHWQKSASGPDLFAMNGLSYLIIITLCVGSICSDDTKKAALLIIDVQKCFLKDGHLEVPGGDEVIPVINNIIEKYSPKFQSIYVSLDFHPPNHVSFASQHVGRRPFDTVILQYSDKAEICRPSTLKNEDNRTVKCKTWIKTIDQMLWPDHCVSNTEEVNLAPELLIDPAKDKFIFKGSNPSIDSYSVFFDNGNLSSTELHERLQSENIQTIFMTGLATDFCVKFTAIDAVHLGYEVYVIKDAIRGVAASSSEEALDEMRNIGVCIIDSSELEEVVRKADQSHKLLIVALICFLFLCSVICLKNNCNKKQK